jgi:hypothetical protein
VASARRKSLFPEGSIVFSLHRKKRKEHLLLNHPVRLVAATPRAIHAERLVGGNAWQVDILHHGPNNREARGFSRKGVNLIGPLPHIAEEAFNRIGAANVAMHQWWEGIKRQQMRFIFT